MSRNKNYRWFYNYEFPSRKLVVPNISYASLDTLSEDQIRKMEANNRRDAQFQQTLNSGEYVVDESVLEPYYDSNVVDSIVNPVDTRSTSRSVFNRMDLDTRKRLQATLQQMGYYKGKIDGLFGNQTYNAIKAFQKKSGLVDDGIVGKKTIGALRNAEFGQNNIQGLREVQRPITTTRLDGHGTPIIYGMDDGAPLVTTSATPAIIQSKRIGGVLELLLKRGGKCGAKKKSRRK